MSALAVSLVVLYLAWFATAPRGRPWAVLERLALPVPDHGVPDHRVSGRGAGSEHRGGPGRSRAPRRHTGASVDVPTVADLLAVAVAAGCPIPQALRDVGSAVREQCRDAPVVRCGESLERGTGLAVALDAMGMAGRGWHTLATQLSLSADSGVPAGEALRRLATQERVRIRRERERRARRLPVVLLVPLTTMVLPAFILVTVVPFVAAGGISLELPQYGQDETGNHD